MQQLNIKDAYQYYSKHINRTERFELLEEHQLPVAGSVPSIDWELFGSILTGSKGTPGYGADLENYEVKSATEGSSFEYQYHLHGGISKLEEDMKVDHIFISYSSNYRDVTVRLVKGKDLATEFESWRAGLLENYSGEAPRQRYRKSIAFRLIQEVGQIVLQIEDGVLVKK